MFSERSKCAVSLWKLTVPLALWFGLLPVCSGQSAPASQSIDPRAPVASAAPADPAPLSTPSITGPLRAARPNLIGRERFGDISINAVVSGTGLLQGNDFPGDHSTEATLSNGQMFIQKTTGWWQFYIQAGAYNIPSLGTPFLATDKAVTDLYGPVPVAYLKLAPGKNTSVLVGSLPTLMGAESSFTFQNMNIERGLLWNQENGVSRGIQVNQTVGKFTASLSWNDGYYSNRYSCISGLLTYISGPHSITFSAMGNLGQTAFRTLATPVQNNSSMYALIYAYKKGSWMVQPYFQYSHEPTNPKTGVVKGASATGGAVLLNHTFRGGFSLAGRAEYLSTTGKAAQQSVNLLFGPGSGGWSITATPTYQLGRFFIRGDLSLVRAVDATRGLVFGPTGAKLSQPRALIEGGFIF